MSAREGGSDKMSAWCQLGREGPKEGKKGVSRYVNDPISFEVAEPCALFLAT